MKILSLNVRQWSRDLDSSKPTFWQTRADAIKKLIERENPDIVFFQELTVPMTWCLVPKGYKKVSGLSISHHIYCKKGIKVKNREWHLHWCRALLATADGRFLNVFSVHSHWNDKIYKKVADQLIAESKVLRDVPTIIGGDWNVEPKIMKQFLKPLALTTSSELTFQNWTKPEQFGELDYFAYRYCSFEQPCTKLDDFVSDHYPVILTLKY